MRMQAVADVLRKRVDALITLLTGRSGPEQDSRSTGATPHAHPHVHAHQHADGPEHEHVHDHAHTHDHPHDHEH